MMYLVYVTRQIDWFCWRVENLLRVPASGALEIQSFRSERGVKCVSVRLTFSTRTARALRVLCAGEG
jgi:hypothetical protein